MASADSDTASFDTSRHDTSRPPDPTASRANESALSVKIVIAGGFGVGKTTLVGTVSEIVPLRTEALMTEASTQIDDLSLLPSKRTTTVAMDFGRITLDDELVLYLFGTPGQNRFWFMWDDISRGAIGAVVLVDTRRLADCFGAIDYFEQRQIPFVVGVNCFDGILHHDLLDVREALQLPTGVPIVGIDARDKDAVKDVLITLVEYAMALAGAH